MEQKSTDAVDTNLRRGIRLSDFMELMSIWLEDLNDPKPSRPRFQIPDKFANRSQPDALNSNEAVLGDTKMPSTSEAINSHLQPDPETRKKVKLNDSQSKDVEDDLRVAQGDKLGEDELTLIFSNTWLSAQDLLNCRLVSKRWRDAATTTLRRRDACVVELQAEPDLDPPCVRKSIGKLREEDKLSQLTELISLSPKFPATNFCIHTSLMTFTSYTLFPDLVKFFKLHGDKIKTLRFEGDITAKCVLDILQIYAPTLESLNLSKVYIKESEEDDGSVENVLQWSSKTVSLKSLTLGSFGDYCNEDNDADSDRQLSYENELIRLLLSSLSKFGSIENVTLDTLQIVLTEGKGHLIRSFKYSLWEARSVPVSQLKKFISLNPKPNLTKITLHLQGECPSSAAIVNSMNEFIEYFKDTVQNLTILYFHHYTFWTPRVKIPPMKKLKSLNLRLESWSGISGEDPRFRCGACGEDVETNSDLREAIFQFQDGISAQNYFLSLLEVSLDLFDYGFNRGSLMSFFRFKSDTSSSPANWNCLPKVDMLKINKIDAGSRHRQVGNCLPATEPSLFSQAFPNIRILKFQCGEVSNLSSALWRLCPNVEFMEISAIKSYSGGWTDVEMSHFVDKAFTGFSDGMLENLRRSAAGIPCEADDLEDLNFEPERPSISDLRHLKELKLKFIWEWSTEFASSITGVHAFSKMENTKFIISYNPDEIPYGFGRENVDDSRNKIEENIDAANDNENEDDRIAKYEELIFGAIKPYVHIVRKRR